MSRILLLGRVLTPDRDLPMATLLVDGKLIEFVAEGVFEPDNATPLIEAGDIIAPGFVDLQVNGFAGNDAASGASALAEISRLLPKS
jgi:N-acetylglucosamine-6-phosphate deacetylase